MEALKIATVHILTRLINNFRIFVYKQYFLANEFELFVTLLVTTYLQRVGSRQATHDDTDLNMKEFYYKIPFGEVLNMKMQCLKSRLHYVICSTDLNFLLSIS